MTAWFQSPGVSCASTSCAVVVRAVLAPLRPAQREGPGQHASHVAIHDGQRDVVRDRQDRARGVEPNAGNGERRLQRPWEAPRVLVAHVGRSAVQVARAMVVAQAGPGRDHVVLARAGQRVDVEEALDEGLVVGDDRLHGRLLQHHLRDPDAVRVAGPPPGQVTAVAPVPGEQAALQGLAQSAASVALPVLPAVADERERGPVVRARRGPSSHELHLGAPEGLGTGQAVRQVPIQALHQVRGGRIGDLHSDARTLRAPA